MGRAGKPGRRGGGVHGVGLPWGSVPPPPPAAKDPGALYNIDAHVKGEKLNAMS